MTGVAGQVILRVDSGVSSGHMKTLTIVGGATVDFVGIVPLGKEQGL